VGVLSAPPVSARPNYKSASGREGEWFKIGLVAGKIGYGLHVCVGDGAAGYLVEQNAAKLGKVKTGRSCINFKKLEDLNLAATMALAKQTAKSGGINAVAWAKVATSFPRFVPPDFIIPSCRLHTSPVSCSHYETQRLAHRHPQPDPSAADSSVRKQVY
jgi:hypothetical protein